MWRWCDVGVSCGMGRQAGIERDDTHGRTLSFPQRLAKWTLSQSSPSGPNGLRSEKASIPRQRSDPRWFRLGGMGYALWSVAGWARVW